MCVFYLLSQSEGTAKLFPVTVARPNLHSRIDDLRKQRKNKNTPSGDIKGNKWRDETLVLLMFSVPY